MPSTLLGLLILIYILIPGYCYYAVRRRLTPTRRVSTIVDAANVMFVAMVTNALVFLAYIIVQLVPWIRQHSPSVILLLQDPKEYLLQSDSRLAYIGIWAVLLLICSSVLAAILAVRFAPNRRTQHSGRIQRQLERLPLRVLDISVWDNYFYRLASDDDVIYLECYMHDGSYSAGVLAWYNTDIDDSPDRDLVLGRPLLIRSSDGEELVEPDHDQHVILSARDILFIIVTYVTPQAIEEERRRVLMADPELGESGNVGGAGDVGGG